MLDRLTLVWRTEDLNPGPADGFYGERTEAAVRTFQERRGITADGVAGPETVDALEVALREFGIDALTLRGAALPRIGIMTSHPGMIAPGRDGEIQSFIALAVRTGCRPVLIPPCADLVFQGDGDARWAALKAMASGLDGILGPGGDDIDPAIYGEENRFAEHPNFTRDRFEADFVLAAMQASLFMFGVCRSHQLWNAAAGGALVQDVQRDGYSHLSQRQSDYGIDGEDAFIVRRDDGAVDFENRVVLRAGSRIAAVLGDRDAILTNSYHHEAVERPGEGFTVVGTVWDEVTQRDTIEVTERWNVFTTQFHPEAMQRDPWERELLQTVGRRALIFRLLKDGIAASDLEARMKAFPEGTFDASDYGWVKGELVR